jgi:hypothetical protein
MNRNEVRQAKDAIYKAIKEHEFEIEQLRLDIRHLQSECEHPVKKQGSDMKDRFLYCPDCDKEF